VVSGVPKDCCALMHNSQAVLNCLTMEGKQNMILCNISNHTANDTASHPEGYNHNSLSFMGC